MVKGRRRLLPVSSDRHPARRSYGFGLIEVMVAMVIALLGIIVMTQVFTLFEGRRRTTSGGDDAITTGALALNDLQRELQQSGWGMTSVQLIGCLVQGQWGPSDAATPTVLTGPTVSLPLVPARINPRTIDAATGLETTTALITGQDANTDVLLVMSGSTNGTVEGDIIISQASVTPPGYVMTSPQVFNPGDRVVPIPSQIQPVPCSQTLTPVVADPTQTTVMANPTPVAPTQQGPRLFNLGPTIKVRVYAVRNRNLTVCDYGVNDCGSAALNGNTAVWVPIASDIVSLRAEYGRDTNAAQMDAVADVWDQTMPVPTTPDPSKNTVPCGRLRASAIRLALVARSGQPEKAPGGVHVTAAVPTWMGNVAINLEGTSPDAAWPTWQDFRYKVFQTVVPLRNVTSVGVRSEC